MKAIIIKKVYIDPSNTSFIDVNTTVEVLNILSDNKVVVRTENGFDYVIDKECIEYTEETKNFKEYLETASKDAIIEALLIYGVCEMEFKMYLNLIKERKVLEEQQQKDKTNIALNVLKIGHFLQKQKGKYYLTKLGGVMPITTEQAEAITEVLGE